MRASLIIIGAAATAAQAAAAQPLPPRRPAIEQVAPAPVPQPAPVLQPAPIPQESPPLAGPPSTGAEAGAAECVAKLRSDGWDADVAAVPAANNPACSVESPVTLKRLRVTKNADATIAFPDAPVVACRFAARFGQWVADLAVPVVRGQLGGELKAIRTGPGFECRNRNHSASGKLSAHASGLAVDIAGLELTDGRRLAVTDRGVDPNAATLRAMRTGACGWFTTILGPGTDTAHATHWHFDIQQHGRSDYYRICQ